MIITFRIVIHTHALLKDIMLGTGRYNEVQGLSRNKLDHMKLGTIKIGGANYGIVELSVYQEHVEM